ncbi:MAG TPA: ABC transporter permease [Aliicoccus persicus]|uniref:ABC transporter permease n=1 Tax=Aliicoccus persicus TaxID=930138 RepID=A0A921DYA7_9STAP|nr:ABC transporter permease [Aliicoccus persicus]
MGTFIRKRVVTGILVIFISLSITFFLIHLAPGDPVSILAGTDNPSPEMIETLNERYGFDQPLPIQFFTYIGGLLQGDLGFSVIQNQPVLELILARIGPTLLLALTGLILAVIIGTSLGIYAARKNGSKYDVFMSGTSYIFDSMPPFWLGMMLILLFATGLGWFPTSGMVDLRASPDGFEYYLSVAKHMVLPLTTIVLTQIPFFYRIARSSVIQTMSEDFITTYKATGMEEGKIFRKYVFKNAILPTITMFGISLAYVLAGLAIIEIVFAWPGMGRLLLDSIMQRDYPLLMGIYLFISISIAVTMVLVDVVYSVIDKRIKNT